MVWTRLQAGNWERILEPGAPQQANTYDCGVFTMMAMKSVCAEEEYGRFSYGQQEVTDVCRALCTLECVSQTLYSPFH